MAGAAATAEKLSFANSCPELRILSGGSQFAEPTGQLYVVEPKPNLILEEKTALSQEDRALTEVNHLLRHRRVDGSYPSWVKKDLIVNLKTAATEAALPFKISETRSEAVLDRGCWITCWMGKAAIQAAASGYKFHRSLQAHERVDIEVDEAKYFEEDLRPGTRKFFISPKMSGYDAPNHIAKAEHLHEDDSIRADWLEYDEVTGKTYQIKQSILVRDIPLQAWVDMLADPDNFLGRAIMVDDRNSALSVMKIHRELEVPIDSHVKTPVDLVREVAKYIKDPEVRKIVGAHIKLFEVTDQAEMNQIADEAADEWFNFEVQLAESYLAKELTPQLVGFINNLDGLWGEEARAVIDSHKTSQGYKMSKKMAIVLESAKRKTLWSRLGVETGDQKILNQLDEKSLTDFRNLSQEFRRATQGSWQYQQAQDEMNRFLASKNIKGGGGCPGSFIDMFGRPMINSENVFKSNSIDEDDMGPLTFSCPHCGHSNKRPPNRLIERCQSRGCGRSVRC